MERHEIESALKEIAQPYADRRVNLFDVAIASFEGNTLSLQGRVLEESNRLALQSGLNARFPELRIDTVPLEVARKANPTLLSVGTNLTSLHDGTSFLAEMISQMLNGFQVEVLWEDKNWCFVRQTDGYLGWTYRPYLTTDPLPQPTHLVLAPVGLLREAPQADSGLVTRVLGGTPVCAAEESAGWARLEMPGGWRGFLPTADLRALNALPLDTAARRVQIQVDAFTLTGVPYLWGGCSANGIDCSGFAQLLHRWVGITIPRDADMQCAAGKAVEPPFSPGDLLFFGEKGEKRRITHVAVSLGGWRIIHSSRTRNGVHVDDVQEVPHLRDSFLAACTFIG